MESDLMVIYFNSGTTMEVVRKWGEWVIKRMMDKKPPKFLAITDEDDSLIYLINVNNIDCIGQKKESKNG